MFREILSNDWDLLSPVLQRHYGLSEGEKIRMKGVLEVKHGKFIKFLMPIIRLTGALVPVEGDNFIVTVENRRIGDTYFWHREFSKDNRVYVFDSKMQQFGNDIVEFVGFGLGIRMGIQEHNSGILYEDKGYVLKVGPWLIRVPLHLLMGRAMIEEYKSDDKRNQFAMKFIVKHPWFGFAFSYMGRLALEE